MDFRKVNENDFEELKKVCKEIVLDMYKNQVFIWNDVYPYYELIEDCKKDELFLGIKDGKIVSFFTLAKNNGGSNSLLWKREEKALYLERFAVSPFQMKRGIGKEMINYALSLTREEGFSWLRLFVWEHNQRAISFYEKCGFHKATGYYDEFIHESFILREFGYEKETTLND